MNVTTRGIMKIRDVAMRYPVYFSMSIFVLETLVVKKLFTCSYISSLIKEAANISAQKQIDVDRVYIKVFGDIHIRDVKSLSLQGNSLQTQCTETNLFFINP